MHIFSAGSHGFGLWKQGATSDRWIDGLDDWLEDLIAEARTWAGVERLTLSVVERAVTARRLYAALGFEAFGWEPDAFRQDTGHGTVRDAALHLTLALGREAGHDASAADGMLDEVQNPIMTRPSPLTGPHVGRASCSRYSTARC